MDFKNLAIKRYSVRRFKDLPVEKEKIDQILETARISPTANNMQPHRIRVITDKSDLDVVNACSMNQTFGAPLVFFVCFDKKEAWERPHDGASSGEIDASIVTTQMMYQAEDLGLGTVWIMLFDPEQARTMFKLPENLVPHAFLCVGYPKDDCKPAKWHFTRKSLEEILF